MRSPWTGLRTSLLCVTLVMASAAIGVSVDSAEAARWKVGGDGSCYFDQTDDGPDQCLPQPTGRWKLDGDNCYFDAFDSGPDQCPPQ